MHIKDMVTLIVVSLIVYVVAQLLYAVITYLLVYPISLSSLAESLARNGHGFCSDENYRHLFRNLRARLLFAAFYGMIGVVLVAMLAPYGVVQYGLMAGWVANGIIAVQKELNNTPLIGRFDRLTGVKFEGDEIVGEYASFSVDGVGQLLLNMEPYNENYYPERNRYYVIMISGYFQIYLPL